VHCEGEDRAHSEKENANPDTHDALLTTGEPIPRPLG